MLKFSYRLEWIDKNGVARQREFISRISILRYIKDIGFRGSSDVLLYLIIKNDKMKTIELYMGGKKRWG